MVTIYWVTESGTLHAMFLIFKIDIIDLILLKQRENKK